MSYELSVLIPIYNEAKTIDKILDKLHEVKELSGPEVQYVIVDDGSTDGTVSKLKNLRYQQDPRFVFIFQKKNGGKGTAIRAGLEKVTGKYVIVQDADLEYDPADIIKLWSAARANNLSVVYGSRNLKPDGNRGRAMFYFGGKLVTWLTNLLYGTKLTDEPTCYKLFRTDVLRDMPLVCRRFEFCPEVTAYAAKKGIPIPEIPISYFPRSKEEGKKIKWRDGIEAIFTLIRLRFDFKNPYVLATLVSLLALGFYLLTWSRTFGGYEGETFQAADNLLLGHYEMKRAGLGAVILYLPFLSLGRLFQVVDYHWFSVVPAVYSAFTVGIVYLICAELLGAKRRDRALLVASIIAFGSSIWPYTNIGMEYQAMLGVSLLLWTLLRWRYSPARPLAVGIVFAWLVIAKAYGLLFGLPMLFFIYVFLRASKNLEVLRSFGFWLQLLLPAVALYFLSLALNYFSGNAFGSYALGHEFQVWHWWEGFYGTLFSFGQGIFIYNPLLWILVFYWPKFWREHRETAIFILSGFLLLLLLTAPFSFWSDETWTVRKLMPILPLLLLPLLSVRFNLGGLKQTLLKSVFVMLLCVSIFIQILGATYDYGKRMNFLYANQLDSFTTMRYIPELSPLNFHVHLLFSYTRQLLNQPPQDFVYQEFSWRSRLFGESDQMYRQVATDLSAYHQPDIYWLQHLNDSGGKNVLWSAQVLVLICGFLLGINYLNARMCAINSQRHQT